MSRTYMKKTCWLCGKEICNTGLAQSSHMRAHVRKGEAVERLNRDSQLNYYTTYHRPAKMAS